MRLPLVRLAIPLLLAGACDDGSGFAGDYAAIDFAREQGACGGTPITEPVPPRDQWFQLADTDGLVAYHACDEQGTCDAQYDLARSFGTARPGDGEWAGYVSSAIPGATCTLSYRVRTLDRGDDGSLEIATLVYRELDGTLTGSACNDTVASERGPAMPCVEDALLTAEDR
jgi:hypothetical protein